MAETGEYYVILKDRRWEKISGVTAIALVDKDIYDGTTYQDIFQMDDAQAGPIIVASTDAFGVATANWTPPGAGNQDIHALSDDIGHVAPRQTKKMTTFYQFSIGAIQLLYAAKYVTGVTNELPTN